MVLATDYYTATGGMQAYTTSGFLRAEVYSVSDTPNFISFCTNDTLPLWSSGISAFTNVYV